ncbi:FG-GAP-like repeat-containing protein [Noviluteimonas gilva]|uniref:DUF4215 domain-containing protein n=1 Tax=Noviluteimonas gilva TaxID=2682097 RepID=A0A7C9LKQ6_9GAMM|nr:FG-GAP-like repeat-containing protein [Lysobacter gilvus]MUV13684.1 hypothetical protein [Lysobacter gilvus]
MRTIRRGNRHWFKGALAAGFLLLALGPAQATFHLMNIVEIFPGTRAAPQAQYVVLQMNAAGQNLVDGHDFQFFNAAGQLTGSFAFPSNVPNGANNAKILIATPEAVAFFNVQADFTMPASLMAAGGKVCFADGIDCVAWGAFTGGTAGVGTPFNATGGGLVSGRAAIRRINGGTSTTMLDASDDTDNCAADFTSGLPAPRNNNNTLGTVPPSTCGNGAIEGLEQCDDGNVSNGDACSSTCLVTTPTARPWADFNGDGRSDLAWRNLSGQNAIWYSANSATRVGVTAVTNLQWRIAGIGDFNGDGRADLLWRNSTTGANVIWRSGSSSFLTSVTSLDSTWSVGGIGDFDGDGKSDIVWRNLSGQNAIWRSGSSALRTAVSTLPQPWRIAGVGDFSGDGRADLLWRNGSTGANSVWRSASSATPTSVTTLATTWSAAGIGDFDGDGRADVVWRNVSGQNAIWRSANSAMGVPVTAIANTAWRIEAVADYNGDRRADLLWRNATTGNNVIWRSASSSFLTSVTTLPISWSVAP